MLVRKYSHVSYRNGLHSSFRFEVVKIAILPNVTPQKYCPLSRSRLATFHLLLQEWMMFSRSPGRIFIFYIAGNFIYCTGQNSGNFVPVQTFSAFIKLSYRKMVQTCLQHVVWYIQLQQNYRNRHEYSIMLIERLWNL